MSPSERTNFLLPLSYSGTEVRMHIDEKGDFWWVAQDVANMLEIKQVRSTLRSFPDDERGVHTMHTLGGPQEVLLINEPGLYRLVFQSRKPEAEVFKRWVFHDVLPTLRRTGVYTVHTPMEPTQGLTTGGYLPPPKPKPREHAQVSWHLARVWMLLRDSGELLSNREIAVRIGIAPTTARAHTRYLRSIGLLDMREVFPRYLYMVSPLAEQQNAGAYQRLNQIAEVIANRSRFE